MKKITLVLLTFFRFLLPFTVAFYESSSNVISLNEEEFEGTVLRSTELWVVEYFAPWCGHCQSFAPEFEKLAQDLKKSGVKVGAVNVDENKKLGQMEGLQSFPTVKFYIGKPSLNPYTKKMFRQSETFMDQRNARAIRRGLFKALPSDLITKVTAESADAFQKKAREKGLGQVIAFTERTSTSPLLLTIANELNGRIAFGEVHSSEEELADQFEVEDFPTLLVVPLEGDPIKFTGDAKQWEEVRNFCAEYAIEVKEDGTQGEAPSSGASTVSGPTELTKENFSDSVLESTAAWVVAYLGAEEKVEDIPSWSKLSKSFEGLIRGGYVNCGSSPDLCEEEEDTPYIKVYPYDKEMGGLKESGTTKFSGKKLPKAVEIAGASLPQLVMVITPDMFMMGGQGDALQTGIGMALNQGKVPMLVTSKKAEPASMLKSLAVEFEDMFQIIQLVEPPEQVLQSLGGIDVPGCLIMVQQNVASMDGDKAEIQMGIMKYENTAWGPFSFDNLASFMMNAIVQSGNTEKLRERMEKKSKVDSAPKKIRELMKITPENWEEVCPAGASALCVLAFLDGYADESNTETSISILKAVLAKENKEGGSPFEFSYTMGNCDLPFSEAFEVDSSMHLPAVVVYSPKKQRFVRHVGRFDESSIRDFLRGVLSNRIKTGPIYQTPVPGTAECEDIGSADEEILEEEDMSDFMAEILEEERKEKERLEMELKEEEELRKTLEEAERKAAAEAEAKKKKKRKKKKKKKQSEL